MFELHGGTVFLDFIQVLTRFQRAFNTLMQFVTFAAQHGMLWANLNQMPGNNSTAGSIEDMNRLGASLGAMAQSDVDAGPDVAPTAADLSTARAFGEHVARCALRWKA